jgi:Fur family zinc uptake transcriptional regulator
LIASAHSNIHEHNRCVSKAKDRFIDRLKQLGKSIGINDEPVLHLLLSNHRAFSAYDIAETLSKMGKRLQPIQIYRSLEKLMTLGVVHRLDTKNGFIACYNDGDCISGQFLICSECDGVTEMNNDRLETEIQSSAKKNNFLIGSKTVEVLGLCKNCYAT